MRSLAFFITLIHSIWCTSLDSHSLWNIFTKLEYKDMKSFAAAHPHLLRDQNVIALIQCTGNFVCAASQQPNPLMLNAIPHHYHKMLIRQAAIDNDEARVKTMIKYGFDPKWLDYPLKRALRLGLDNQAQWIRSLLPHSMRSISIVSIDPKNRKRGLLFDAVVDANERQIRQLIAEGADINTASDGGYSLLMHVAYQGLTRIMEALLDAGANVNARSNQNQMALGESILRGDSELVRLLLDHGAKVNDRGEDGSSALLRAASRGSVQILNMLIERGAKVDGQTTTGQTALIYAADSGQEQAVNVLIEAGAHVNLKDRNGNTAILSAASSEDVQTVRALIRAGADVNAKDGDGYTALMEASYEGYLDIVRVLIKAGAKVNFIDVNGMTAMDYAMQEGHFEVVEELKRAKPSILKRIKGFLSSK